MSSYISKRWEASKDKYDKGQNKALTAAALPGALAISPVMAASHFTTALSAKARAGFAEIRGSFEEKGSDTYNKRMSEAKQRNEKAGKNFDKGVESAFITPVMANSLANSAKNSFAVKVGKSEGIERY